MKHFLLLCLLLGGAHFVYSQTDYQRMGLVEHVTNTRCPVCAANNPDFYEELHMRTDYVHIAYHAEFPYDDCKFYQANEEGNMVRVNYYSVSGTPTAIINGLNQKPAGNVTQSDFDAVSERSDVGLELTLYADYADLTVNNELWESDNYDMRAYVLVVEDPIEYEAPNGEEIHHDVFRYWLSPTDGEKLEEQENAFTYALSHENLENGNNAKIIAFVQDEISGEILNASETATTISSNTENNIQGLRVYPLLVHEALNVELQEAKNLEMHIVDMNGRRVLEMENQERHTEIPVRHLQVGAYILQLRDKETKSRGQYRFVKQ